MCLDIFLKGSNWNGWPDRQWEFVPEQWGTRVKSSCLWYYWVWLRRGYWRYRNLIDWLIGISFDNLFVLLTRVLAMLAASFPSHSLRSNNDNTLSVPRVKTNTGARAFRSCLFGTTSHSLSVQPIQFLPLRNTWRHISLSWPFSHRSWHARLPVNCYGAVSSILLLNTDSAAAPLSLATQGILALLKFDWLIEWVLARALSVRVQYDPGHLH